MWSGATSGGRGVLAGGVDAFECGLTSGRLVVAPALAGMQCAVRVFK